ncbi:MAG: type VI secretion system contractile sheath small subunit, partial [Gammaproteobacteria bacterium]|nr:type VI secretion system contractile sheath small subunit [Gammaproteobacteria bacterium]
KIHNDGSELRINLVADSLQKFRPETIVQQVPELQKILAMRNLLKDLKSNLLDNAALRRRLEKIAQDQTQLNLLQDALHKDAPIEGELVTKKGE